MEYIYAGSLGHADNLRSVTTNLVGIQKQTDIVKSFTERNGLKLNMERLELLTMSNGNSPLTVQCKLAQLLSYPPAMQDASEKHVLTICHPKIQY